MRQLAWVVLVSIGCGGSSSSFDDQSTEGTSGGPCYPNSTCNAGLVCVANVCGATDAAGTDTSSSDTTPTTDSTAMTDTAPSETTPPAPPYAESAISAACDMITGDPTNVPGANGDDVASSKTALPFAFKYFGAAVTQYSMASNGFLSLAESSSGGTPKQPDNVAIPTAAEPNGIVAPFWDDLVPMFSEARVATFGTAPNRRLVVSWVHWTIKGEVGARLTFQAKLFETTNVIEFHYCAMSPDGNARATGSSATIGLESLDGTAGIQHSFNTAASATTGKALRFTPAM